RPGQDLLLGERRPILAAAASLSATAPQQLRQRVTARKSAASVVQCRVHAEPRLAHGPRDRPAVPVRPHAPALMVGIRPRENSLLGERWQAVDVTHPTALLEQSRQ